MRIVHLSTYDIVGGAARAAYRLHESLRSAGASSKMIVRFKKGTDDDVLSASGPFVNKYLSRWMLWDLLPLLRYPKWNRAPWSVGRGAWSIDSLIDAAESDIINLHWICRGFVPVETLSNIRRPLVWTLHDMWAFSGGCHYAGDCVRYRDSCGKCPQLGSSADNDLSRRIWEKKRRMWDKLNLTIVSPSKWLADRAKESSLFGHRRMEVIPSGINTTMFRPLSANPEAVPELLDPEKKVILVGAIRIMRDKRKGLRHLFAALNKLADDGWSERAQLLIFGCRPARRKSLNPGLEPIYVGNVDNDAYLGHLYDLADVFVAPSTQENLPNTVMEAMSCGTPCVAFDIGGMPDLIDHKRNGYLAKPFDTDDLADGVAWVIRDDERNKSLSLAAREKIERYCDYKTVAERYMDLYKEILGS